MNLEQYEAIYPPRRDLPPGAEVTRVAPSPTGRPHIGTALQAMIDKALAEQSGGRFILRIEDTDRKRLVEGAVDDIVEALRWLGLTPGEGPIAGGDYGPYYQSERLPLYQAAAAWLVERGHAYHCFCSPERLEALRRQQEAQKQPPMYDRACRNLSPEEVAERIAAGEKPVVRLVVPGDTQVVFEDPIRGEIVFNTNLVDDQVLLKSDGYPTYHLAVVVDDHFMRVTTAVRGEEWISSTPKHLLLYRYFGWPVPRIVHTVLLRDAERRKLSKRTGDTSIAWFRTQGYLPEGFRNFLTRIIWNHPENKDVYPFADFVDHFATADLGKSGPVASHDLLTFINGQHLRNLSPEQVYEVTARWLDEMLSAGDDIAFEIAGRGEPTEQLVTKEELARFRSAFTRDPDYSRRVLAVEPERYKKLGDIVLGCAFFYPETFVPPTREMVAKPLGNVAGEILNRAAAQHRQEDAKEEWEAKIRQLAAEANVGAGKVFMTIRVALTGSDRTPPLYKVMQVLGDAVVRERLQRAAQLVGG